MKPCSVYTDGGKYSGRVSNGTFHRKVDKTRHQLRVPPAWAMDKSVLTRAEQAGAKAIRFHDPRTKEAWVVSVEHFKAHGIPFNRGHGWQIMLPLRFWTEKNEDKPKQRKLRL